MCDTARFVFIPAGVSRKANRTLLERYQIYNHILGISAVRDFDSTPCVLSFTDLRGIF